jgi:hypothetical protein
MLRIATPVVVCLCLTAPAFAQAEKPRSGDDAPESKKEDEDKAPSRGYRGMGGFGGGDWTKNVSKMLTKELDLDSDQAEQVSKILKDSMGSVMKRMGEFFGGGGAPGGDGFAKARSAMEEVREEIANKINKVLTPAQRREFENMVDKFDRRANSFEQSQRAWADPGQLFNPKPISKRLLMGKAERSLFLGPDETAVVMPFIEKVIDTRQALYEGRKVRRKDLMNAVDSGASKGEIEQRLAEIRAAEQFQHLELIAGEQALREILTLQQEARFVAIGVLE